MIRKDFRLLATLVWLVSTTTTTTTRFVLAWHTCADGVTQCPTGNTCCMNRHAETQETLTTCVSGKNETAGDCCADSDYWYNVDDDQKSWTETAASSFSPSLPHKVKPTTGCKEGYMCARNVSTKETYCTKRSTNTDDTDPPVLPRYKLCSLPGSVYQNIYGFPVNPVYNATLHVAYLSTMGPIDLKEADIERDNATDDNDDNTIAEWQQKQQYVTTAVIVIHGSGRNVDDYICCMSQALPEPNRTIVIAPWFLAPVDGPVNITTTNQKSTSDDSPAAIALRWSQLGRIWHTWRYGADALNGPISSYAAVDAIVQHLREDPFHNFPALERIIVVGHSAGGQFTQRWALLSPVVEGAATTMATKTSPLTKLSLAISKLLYGEQYSIDQRDRHLRYTSNKVDQVRNLPGGGAFRRNDIPIRIVVANPRSYCYLDARRFDLVDGSFTIPKNGYTCPWYNEWEWGLGNATSMDGKDYLPTPYKDRVLADAGGPAALVARYANRDVVYIAGELDVIPNSGDCPATLQGRFRLERSRYFFESLALVYGKPTHHRLVVAGSNHDHCLMFQSPEGQQAMFGSFHNTGK